MRVAGTGRARGCLALLVACVIGCRGVANDTNSADTYVSQIRDCKVRDRVSLESCFRQMLENLRPLLPSGVPQLGLPPFEPLHIANVSFTQGAGFALLYAEFTDLEVRGLSNYTTVYSRSDPRRLRFKVGLHFPHLEIKGKYNVSGNLILVPIQGNGPFCAELFNVKADLYNWLEVVKVPDETTTEEKPQDDIDKKYQHMSRYVPLRLRNRPKMKKELRLEKTYTNIKTRRCKVKLGSLFERDPFLGETLTSFLNDNSQTLLKEITPIVNEKITMISESVFGDAINHLPFPDWMAAVKHKELSSEELR